MLHKLPCRVFVNPVPFTRFLMPKTFGHPLLRARSCFSCQWLLTLWTGSFHPWSTHPVRAFTKENSMQYNPHATSMLIIYCNHNIQVLMSQLRHFHNDKGLSLVFENDKLNRICASKTSTPECMHWFIPYSVSYLRMTFDPSHSWKFLHKFFWIQPPADSTLLGGVFHSQACPSSAPLPHWIKNSVLHVPSVMQVPSGTT